MVNDKELIALSLANVSNMIGARNPTNLGNPVTNGKIYEGLLKSIPKVLEIAGNGGSISQAKEIVKDATGFRK